MSEENWHEERDRLIELLEAKIAEEARSSADRIRERLKKTLVDLIEVGSDLLVVKGALPHGQFGPWLRAEFGEKAVDWFAYPYGFDSEDVHRAVADAAYAGGLRVGGGWHRASDSARFMRPRLCVGPGLSLDGFRARLTGARLA